MQRNTYLVLGLLLLGLSGLVASCAPLDTVRDEPDEPEEQRPYRIQVDMTSDKGEAEQRLAQVQSWWEELPDAERPAPLEDSGLDPDIVWQQPYYRIRIGHFTSREAAEEALSAVKEQFSGAFIAREQASASRQ